MRADSDDLRVWQTVEIEFTAQTAYANPYTDTDVWVVLTGPDGSERKVWGFWDGGQTFRVRLTAPLPGVWRWRSGSRTDDAGLAGRSGAFQATAWSEAEKQANPNRRGFITPSPTGRSWQYADGTDFYLLADTWWGAGTWRYPMADGPVALDYVPAPDNFSFEGGVQWLCQHGFNSIGMIAALPNWAADGPMYVFDEDGITIRSGKCPHDNTCMSMHSENGHRAFAFPGRAKGHPDTAPDYDRVVPEYFQDLDRKMFHLSESGMVPYLETVRRDCSLVWYTYHDWPLSFSRFVNYVAARYGSLNLIYSLLHFDTPDHTMPPSVWNAAFSDWYSRFTDGRGMPFGQPTVIMGSYSTFRLFGHVTESPWLQAHSVGNLPKDHTMEGWLEEAMKAHPPVPGYCNEPYYVGWAEEPRPEMGPGRRNNEVDGERVEKNSDRDNYFARAHAYGHMTNGGLAGHIVGTGSRWCVGPGERYAPNFPPPGETLHYTWLRDQSRFLREFLMSEGAGYRELEPANEALTKRKAEQFGPEKLEGWAHLVKTPDNRLALAYFELHAHRQDITGLAPGSTYHIRWFNPRDGEWIQSPDGRTDDRGVLSMPEFPSGGDAAAEDWAVKLLRAAESRAHSQGH